MQLDPDWVAIFDRPRVENCDELFAFKCPKQWEKLQGTDDPTVRQPDISKARELLGWEPVVPLQVSWASQAPLGGPLQAVPCG